MNQYQAEALYNAERMGVRQIRGAFSEDGGYCALGWLNTQGFVTERELMARADGCPLCGATTVTPAGEARAVPIACEYLLIIHLNDDHGLTFSEIARKLGPDSA